VTNNQSREGEKGSCRVVLEEEGEVEKTGRVEYAKMGRVQDDLHAVKEVGCTDAESA
jgi:hypothetical protein